MRGLLLALAATAVLAFAALTFGYTASPAEAHRSGGVPPLLWTPEGLVGFVEELFYAALDSLACHSVASSSVSF